MTLRGTTLEGKDTSEHNEGVARGSEETRILFLVYYQRKEIED